MGMSVGSMVGSLARRAFGVYDLPIPRADVLSLVLVPPTIDEFASQWSIDARRDAAVGAWPTNWPGSHCSRSGHVADHLRDRSCRRPRRRVPARPQRPRRPSSARARRRSGIGRQPVRGDPSRRSATPRSSSVRFVPPEQIAMEPQLDAAVATTIGVDRLGGRRRGRAIDRRQRAPDRRGGASPPGRDLSRRRVRRAAPRYPTRSRPDRSWQGVRTRCGRSGRRARPGPALHRAARGDAHPERDSRHQVSGSPGCSPDSLD